MNNFKSLLIKNILLGVTVISLMSCDKDKTDNIIDGSIDAKQYFVGIEAGVNPSTDILSNANSLSEGIISPINNGFEQASWSVYIQGKDQVFSASYSSGPEFTSYSLVNGILTKGDNFFTDMGVFAADVVDENTMVLMGAPRKGLSEKKIYIIDTKEMSISKSVSVDFGNDIDNNMSAFPVDLKVRDGKLFVAYFMKDGDKFRTPMANEAKVAVFSYPGLKLEKIIIDNRTSNIGRYYTQNALEIDEKGNIYTYSPSSIACGYNPIPEKNSGILRINKGETEFDSSYFIDFEKLSGGYKINDLYYVANGKAVVRILKEDENDITLAWAAYKPASETPLMEFGIIDLVNKSFTLIPNMPKSGGGWTAATLVEGTKLHVAISNSKYSGIYTIDTKTATATKGADIKGGYAKAILSLTSNL